VSKRLKLKLENRNLNQLNLAPWTLRQCSLLYQSWPNRSCRTGLDNISATVPEAKENHSHLINTQLHILHFKTNFTPGFVATRKNFDNVIPRHSGNRCTCVMFSWSETF